MPPKRDPNKPKGRTSAYAFYIQEKSNESKAKGIQVNFSVFSKECAEKWKTIDKTKYNKMSEEDKVRYDREMQDYVPPQGAGRKRGGKKVKDPNMPKRAM